MKIYLKLWKNESKRPTIYHSTKSRRIAQILGRDSFQKAYLRVGYGKMTDVFGKEVEAYNDGEYFSKRELKNAFRAFIKEGE